MPLHPRLEILELHGQEVLWDPVIEQGKIGCWIDKAIGGIVIARCMKPDEGGEIFISENPQQTESGIILYSCTQEDLAEVILPGFDFEMEIINQDDKLVKLVIQHEMPNGQINSLN